MKLIVATEIDDGVRSHALPYAVFLEGEEECWKVERERQSILKIAEIFYQLLVLILIEQFGKLYEKRYFCVEYLSSAEEVLVLVVYLGLETEVSAHEPIVPVAERGGVVDFY